MSKFSVGRTVAIAKIITQWKVINNIVHVEWKFVNPGAFWEKAFEWTKRLDEINKLFPESGAMVLYVI